jgi:DNA-binding CsgD family transcriptional regulator
MLRIVGGRLAATDMDSDRTLREVIAAADSGHSPNVKDTPLPLVAHDGRHYIAHVLPLAPPTHSRASACPTAAVALLVRRVALDKPASEAIAKMYRLTPRELRVLLSLVEVGGVPDVARVLNISEATVRTHVARLFDKTGVSRQVDLVKIVAGFSNPLLVG